MEHIRSFAEADVDAVADLHRQVFEDSTLRREQGFKDYFAEVFLRNPWVDPALPSLVYEQDGKIIGFQGILPRRMYLNGESIRVAVGSQLMVATNQRNTLAGMQLLKKYLSGPQDLSLTDGPVVFMRKPWESLGGVASLLYSMHWTKPLRAARYSLSRVPRRGLLGALATVARPFSFLPDALLEHLPNSPFRFSFQSPEEELDPATLLECLLSDYGGCTLCPVYDLQTLQWLLQKAAEKKQPGNLQKVLVRANGGRILGWYLYYLHSKKQCEVLQLGARKKEMSSVLAHLFYHAYRRGAIAVSGRLDPRFAPEFLEMRCLFRYGHPWTLVHSRRADILDALRRGDAFLSRLEGEWWLRFIGG